MGSGESGVGSGEMWNDGESSVGSPPWGVGSRQWGNVELLTLTLLFPCNRNNGEWGVGSRQWGNVE